MALKLQVPWRREPLPVQYRGHVRVIDAIRASNSLHVEPSANDVIVKDFFGVNNRVPDVSRYHIGDDGQPVSHCDIRESQLYNHNSALLCFLWNPRIGTNTNAGTISL